MWFVTQGNWHYYWFEKYKYIYVVATHEQQRLRNKSRNILWLRLGKFCVRWSVLWMARYSCKWWYATVRKNDASCRNSCYFECLVVFIKTFFRPVEVGAHVHGALRRFTPRIEHPTFRLRGGHCHRRLTLACYCLNLSLVTPQEAETPAWLKARLTWALTHLSTFRLKKGKTHSQPNVFIGSARCRCLRYLTVQVSSLALTSCIVFLSLCCVYVHEKSDNFCSTWHWYCMPYLLDCKPPLNVSRTRTYCRLPKPLRCFRV